MKIPRISSVTQRANVTLITFFLLKHFSTLAVLERPVAPALQRRGNRTHVATSHIPTISTRLPTVACNIVNEAKPVPRLLKGTPMLSKEGTMMANIATVCNTMPLPINMACFTMLCLSLAYIAKPRTTRMMA